MSTRVEAVQELHLHYAQGMAAGFGPMWCERTDALEDALRAELGPATPSEKDGGAAFPFVMRRTPRPGQEVVVYDKGMTLRQHYQGQALAGLCARMDKARYYDLEHETVGGRTEAKVAAILAGRMLDEDAGR